MNNSSVANTSDTDSEKQPLASLEKLKRQATETHVQPSSQGANNSVSQLPRPEPETTSNHTLSSDTAPQPQVSTLTQKMASNPAPSLGEYLKRKGSGEDIGWVDTREKVKNDLVTGVAKLAGKLFR